MCTENQTPNLTRLLGPHASSFAGQAWGVRPVLSTLADRGGRDTFDDLFGLEAADELIAHRGLRTPFIRMAKDGKTLPDAQFCGGGGVGAGIGDQVHDDKVRRLFAGGATLVLQALHRTWQPIAAFSQDLAAELGHPAQVNCYITPPQNQGFSDHYDVHDVFVVQISGSKRWTIREPVLRHPLREQTWDRRADAVRRAADSDPILDVTLQPGDCLYLPRGFIHSARACGGVSAHLTIGIHNWTGQHLMNAVIAAARGRLRDQDRVRASLPAGVDVGDEQSVAAGVETIKAALIDAIAGVGAAEVARSLLAEARDAQRPAAMTPLAQLVAAADIDDDSVVRLRPHLMLQTWVEGDSLIVRSRAGRCAVPIGYRGVLDTLAGGTDHRVGDLPSPGLVAARDLVTEGLAERVRR